jgi:hypothetical protein
VVTAAAAERDVRTVVDAFWRGWTVLDPAAILATIADRPDTLLIGTDEPEYWRGKGSLTEPFAAMAGAFDEERVAWADGDPVISVVGDVAWVVGRVATAVRIGAETIESAMRATFVLVRQGGAWAVVHAHFSVGPTAPVAGY